MVSTQNKKKIALVVLLVVFFIAGMVVNRTAHQMKRKYCNQQDLRYINQQLNCASQYVISKRAYGDLGIRLTKYIEDNVASGKAKSISIYFRDLQNGPTLGINEHDKFVPASLLKMPLLIAYLRVAESNPNLLKTELMFDSFPPDIEQSQIPRELIQENTYYSVEELLRRMIVYSDNRAYNALRTTLSEYSPQNDLFKETIMDLGVLDPQSFNEETLSVKSYTSIFVQLYHASFFDKKETSNTALEFLTQVNFKQGLNKGVPEGVVVAHKFGERSGLPENGKQLHDCGIVYFAGNPYALCVMTRGTDFDALESIIGEISKMFYEEVEYRKIEK